MVNRKLFRPTLTDVKEQFPARPIQAVPAQGAQRKKPAPPEQTHAENFYYVKQMQSRTPVAVVLTDGEILRGSVEWYDRDCIKYLYKEGDDAAQGGANGSNGSNGSGGSDHSDE